MVIAGIKVPDTVLVRDAIDLSRSASEPFLFNHAMRSWLFGVLLSESAERAPDAELLAVATIPHDKQGAILAEFPRLALKNGFKDCLCNIVRRKPATTFDNIVRDFGVRYVEGYTSPNFADVVANAPFSE